MKPSQTLGAIFYRNRKRNAEIYMELYEINNNENCLGKGKSWKQALLSWFQNILQNYRVIKTAWDWYYNENTDNESG